MINLRDQLIMKQPLKFCLNGGEKEYPHYQFCYVQEIGCAEIGFSRREIN